MNPIGNSMITHDIQMPVIQRQDTENFVVGALIKGDAWLDSVDGAKYLDALIEQKADLVFSAALIGGYRDWQKIAQLCIEEQLDLDAKKIVLSILLKTGYTIDDCIEKTRFLLDHMGQQDIVEVLRNLVSNGDLPGIKMSSEVDRDLLNATVKLNKSEYGSLLHFAFQARQPAIALFLMEAFPDRLERKTSSGETVLHLAVSCDLGSLIPDILKAAPSLASKGDAKDRTPLHSAYSLQHGECIRLLALHAKNYDELIHITDSAGWTVLHFMAGSRQSNPTSTDILSITVARFPKLRTMYGHKLETPLHLAAFYGNVQAAKILLHCAPYLAKKETKNGENALDMAVGFRHTDMVKLLVPALSKEVDDLGRTVLLKPFDFCVHNDLDENTREIARTIWEGITHPNTRGRMTGPEFLREAARTKGDGVAIALALEFDPELAESADLRDMPLLHIAAESGNLDGIKHLIRALDQKKLHEQIKSGLRAIDVALRNKHVFIVDALLSADKRLSDKFGSLAPIFDTPADRLAWRDLAVTIADNDYAHFLAKGISEKKFRDFVKRLNGLSDREIAQRLAMFAIWSDEASEDDNHRQGFERGIDACQGLSELFSDKWLMRGERWKSIQLEAANAIRQLHRDGELPVSLLGKELIARLTPLPTTENTSSKTDADDINISASIRETSTIVDESPGHHLERTMLRMPENTSPKTNPVKTGIGEPTAEIPTTMVTESSGHGDGKNSLQLTKEISLQFLQLGRAELNVNARPFYRQGLAKVTSTGSEENIKSRPHNSQTFTDYVRYLSGFGGNTKGNP